MPSPFLTPGTRSQPDILALLHLRRDHALPTILRIHDDEDLGYKEGKVTTTRFGSYPHSTLLDQPWGTQIVASKVDTGSRGRKPHLKRKAADLENANSNPSSEGEAQARPLPQAAVQASSGFCHLLYPTPETWTASLPHRTQVVYTPDYSYILHRLRVRPGGTIIEAGAGSGSFTHAAARAIFNGYPSAETQTQIPPAKKRRRFGKVCSFEFHAQRVERVREEIRQHGLDDIVRVNHRDVYADGFLLPSEHGNDSPKASAIFLDLPAPWLALKHLTRNPENGVQSPLDPTSPVYICTFSPCLEQVQRTISVLRQQGWLNIEMVEVNHHRIEARRERYGLESEGIRGATVFPKSVDEAISKMRSVDERARKFREAEAAGLDPAATASLEQPSQQQQQSSQSQAQAAQAQLHSQLQSSIPAYSQGRLVHRSEQDLKTHTSYLLFAVLPRDWTEDDEAKCRKRWPSHKVDSEAGVQKSKKQMKREAREQRMEQQRLQQQEHGEKEG